MKAEAKMIENILSQINRELEGIQGIKIQNEAISSGFKRCNNTIFYV